jgi:hypothetical protein
MKAGDFGALETAKLLNGPFKTLHCSFDRITLIARYET